MSPIHRREEVRQTTVGLRGILSGVALRRLIGTAFLFHILHFHASSISAQDSVVPNPRPTVQSCADCHDGNAAAPMPGPPREILEQSVHSGLSCDSCHASITMEAIARDSPSPHGPARHRVDCGECHEEAAATYQRHGRSRVGEDADLPACWDCHGGHDILPSRDPRSRVHVGNLAATCMLCHTDVDLVKQHEVLAEAPIRLYQSSVHGRAIRKGRYAAANCSHCHAGPDDEGTPTAHRILDQADADSTINRSNIPDTCGKCHKAVADDFREGIHGRLVQRGVFDAPVCITCHGEHGIISPGDPASPVSAAKVAEQTCGRCHESVVLNERYGIPGGRLKSYVDTYHGHKSKAGRVRVANCASCHGAHRILPSSDPTSSIHPDNLQRTCAECHPGISPALAKTGIHTTSTGIRVGWPEFFRRLYLVLITVTIGLMLLHNIADWVREVKRIGKRTFVFRLTLNETLQHWVLAVSFIALVVSGFALRFSEAWWVQLVFGWGDGAGFLLRGTIHRIAAVVFVILTIWHVFYLLTRRGRTMFREMIANRRDLIHLKQNCQYFLGRRERKPEFGTFTYMEKCEYWALAWGAIIMIGTGLMLWFDNYFITEWNLPKGFLDVMLVIHYYEAWLASLAVLVWHLYSTLFKPGVYPMNPAWLTGKMPKAMYVDEHPRGPRLKGRTLSAEHEEAPVGKDEGGKDVGMEESPPKLAKSHPPAPSPTTKSSGQTPSSSTGSEPGDAPSP